MRRSHCVVIAAAVAATAILASVVTEQAKSRNDSAIADTTSYPVLAAHRGGAGLWPQNTMTAFANSTTAVPGVALEMDVVALKDGTLVTFHDERVDELSANDMSGSVKGMTRPQWEKLRIKGPGGTVAPASTFEEVLDEYGGSGTLLLVELKDHAVAAKFIEAVWSYRGQVIVQSFDDSLTKRFVKSGLHAIQLEDYSPDKLIPGVHSVGVHTSNITPELINTAHHEGVKVWAWGDSVTRSDYDHHDRGLDGYMVNDPTG